MNKVIILGVGYIGTNLANYIVSKENVEVYILGSRNEYIDYLKREVEFIHKRIEEITIDDYNLFENAIVIDAVGSTNATSTSADSSNILLQNCFNRINLINKLSLQKIKKYVFLSSGGTIYSDSINPHKEDEISDPKSIYALEKSIIENYLTINSLENSNLDYLILRISNPYGGIVSKNKRQGIIDVTISKLKNNEELEFFGDLNNVRDYIYIKNLVEYIYGISITDIRNEIFNIGTGIGTTVRELFDIIEKVYSKEIKINLKKINTNNIKCNILDVGKITSVIRLDKIYTLEEGIKDIEISRK